MSCKYIFKCDSCGVTHEYWFSRGESEVEYYSRIKKETKEIIKNLQQGKYGNVLREVFFTAKETDVSARYYENLFACDKCRNVEVIKYPSIIVTNDSFDIEINVNPICTKCENKISFLDGKYKANDKRKCPRCQRDTYWSEGLILCDFG